MTEATTHMIDVPGAVLAYDVRPGSDAGMTPLVMVGSLMAAAGFTTLASYFTDRTVITYDPRQSERNALTSDADPTDADPTPEGIAGIPKQLDTVVRHVDDAKRKGATVLAGGKSRPDLGPFFYEPTILTDVDDTMDVYSHETFGPLVSLYRVADEEEAITKPNDSEYGLNFSVWTAHEERGYRVASRLEAGTVNVNDAYAAAWGSMGGMKAYGLGRRRGEHGILKYSESQTIAIERILPVGVPDDMSPKTYARVATRVLRLPGVK